MKIDRTHQPWMIASIAIFGVSVLLYILYAARAPGGPRGGSAVGLTFGIVGYAMMLYAGLLGARKRVPVWRLGRAQTWMRGHLWLGLLSLPLILFHGGFHFRGPLTAVLMWLFFIVIVSGLAGAAIQHFVPRMMTARVPLETIYEEIPHVRAQLCQEADQLAATVYGAGEVSTLVDIEQEDRARFQQIYVDKVRPFLMNPEGVGTELSDARRTGEVFESLRRLLAAPVHPILDNLQNICEEEHQLSRQIRIYQWLHGWLLVHVPLSIALLVLGGVHAVMALRY